MFLCKHKWNSYKNCQRKSLKLFFCKGAEGSLYLQHPVIFIASFTSDELFLFSSSLSLVKAPVCYIHVYCTQNKHPFFRVPPKHICLWPLISFSFLPHVLSCIKIMLVWYIYFQLHPDFHLYHSLLQSLFRFCNINISFQTSNLLRIYS